jgi:hypothetical protein
VTHFFIAISGRSDLLFSPDLVVVFHLSIAADAAGWLPEEIGHIPPAAICYMPDI